MYKKAEDTILTTALAKINQKIVRKLNGSNISDIDKDSARRW